MIIIIIIIIQGDNKHESDQIDNRAGSSSINQLKGWITRGRSISIRRRDIVAIKIFPPSFLFESRFYEVSQSVFEIADRTDIPSIHLSQSSQIIHPDTVRSLVRGVIVARLSERCHSTDCPRFPRIYIYMYIHIYIHIYVYIYVSRRAVV